MASVLIDAVTMRRGETTMLDAVTLDVPDRQSLVVLGPSGAGKSALLRVVAGLDEPNAGRVFVDGVDITELPTAKRGIAMVFQDSALFPFMSVHDNVAFPLAVRKTPKDELEARVLAESRVLDIQHLLDRKPGQLSAGHQQLVQAARALVRAPKLFLMDEPLSRVDAQLRGLMRREIRLLQSGYGVTMLYVTNDPEEAMAMADRIAVLDHGRVLQVGPPLEVYRRPSARVVASVVGNPPMSFLPGKITADHPGFWVEVGPLRIRAWDPRLETAIGPVDVGVRPDEVAIDEGGVPGVVVRMEHHGSSSLIDVEVAPGVAVPARVEVPLPVGSRVSVALMAAHVFDRVTGTALGHVDAGVT